MKYFTYINKYYNDQLSNDDFFEIIYNLDKVTIGFEYNYSELHELLISRGFVDTILNKDDTELYYLNAIHHSYSYKNITITIDEDLEDDVEDDLDGNPSFYSIKKVEYLNFRVKSIDYAEKYYEVIIYYDTEYDFNHYCHDTTIILKQEDFFLKRERYHCSHNPEPSLMLCEIHFENNNFKDALYCIDVPYGTWISLETIYNILEKDFNFPKQFKDMDFLTNPLSSIEFDLLSMHMI